MYIADYGNHVVRRVAPDGLISTIAGNGIAGTVDRTGPATQISIQPVNVTIGKDGDLYISEGEVLRWHAGVITTVAGNGSRYFLGSKSGPLQTGVRAEALAVAPDGSLYITDSGTIPGHDDDTPQDRILRLSAFLPPHGTSASYVGVSRDGHQTYEFDSTGRLVKSIDSLTGSLIYAFSYDEAGKLVTVSDGNGNATSIVRDPAESAVSIIAPFGQQTKLMYTSNGQLATVSDPTGAPAQMAYDGSGMLIGYVDRNGGKSSMSYDNLGRLLNDQDAAGGTTRLRRQELGDGGYKITTTNGVGRTRLP